MDQDIRILLRAARAAPSADNSQPWCFSLGERQFSVAFDSERAGEDFFGPTSPATLLAIGGLVENLRETARVLEIDAQIENLVDSPSVGFPYLKVHVRLPLKEQIPEDLAVLSRHTNRFPYHSRPIDNETLKLISSLQETPARLNVISDTDQIREISKLVILASEIRFQIKEIHLWLVRSLRFSNDEVAKGDGLDIRTLLLPPGGKALLRILSDWEHMKTFNRFGGYKFLAREEAKLVSKAPALVTVTAPRNNAGLFAAGQLIARSWTALNANKVAVHPYFVISDQLNRLQEDAIPPRLVEKAMALQKGCQQVFGFGEGESLHMLLRAGYPKVEPLRSQRLPLDRLIK